MSETHPPSRTGLSIAAVIAGMLVGIVITLGTDVVLHALGVFPPWGASMVGFDRPLLLATTLIGIRGRDGFVIAADSKVTYRGNGINGPATVCKIYRSRPCISLLPIWLLTETEVSFQRR